MSFDVYKILLWLSLAKLMSYLLIGLKSKFCKLALNRSVVCKKCKRHLYPFREHATSRSLLTIIKPINSQKFPRQQYSYINNYNTIKAVRPSEI